MATIFVRHNVRDFAHWKKAYDDFDNERRGMGVTGHGVYQADDNPRDVTVYHHFDNMDKAREFVQSDRLREVMNDAGVDSEPEIWFTNRVD
ncbi:MAG: cyclase [Gammaproteobacteria bacterium]|nr:cyclase [Gammaproteobacteria bacterium]NND60439.1 cyclase [Gammaproteobacteria bacterium]